MSDINFCNTKEQLNHLGEVVTGKVDGSPTGADIDTSTLPYTGQVRKTLPALEEEYQNDIDNFVQLSDQVIVDKTAEFDASIASKEAEADAAIDSYRFLSKGDYSPGILLSNKFEFIEYNGEAYFATNPPYTTTATTPDADGNLFISGYTTFESVASKIGNKNELSNSNFLTPSPDSITHPNATPESYVAGTQIFSGIYAGDSGCTITFIDGRVNCTAGDYQFKLSNTGGLERVPAFTSSVSDYDGIPKTTGVSHTLVSGEYVVTVAPAAGDVFSVKLEQGNSATKHEVGYSQAELLTSKLVSSFDFAMKSSNQGAVILETAGHTVVGFGAAKYIKSGTTGTPSSGDESLFYDKDGVGWTLHPSQAFDIEMFGGDHTAYDNSDALIKAANFLKRTDEQYKERTEQVPELIIPLRDSAFSVPPYADRLVDELTLTEPMSHIILVGDGEVEGVYRHTVARNHNRTSREWVGVRPSQLTSFNAAASPVVVVVGDSISALTNNNLGISNSYYNSIVQSIQYGDSRNITFHNRAIGGLQAQHFAGITAIPGVTLPPWWDDEGGTKTWMDQVSDLNPDLVIVSFGMNDTVGLRFSHLTSIRSQIKSFTSPSNPDVVWGTCTVPHRGAKFDDGLGQNLFAPYKWQEGRDQAAGCVRAFANYWHDGIIDLNRQTNIVRDGRDIIDTNLIEHKNPTFSNGQLTYTTKGADFSVNFVIDCANITTDSNFLYFQMGPEVDNVGWLRVDAGRTLGYIIQSETGFTPKTGFTSTVLPSSGFLNFRLMKAWNSFILIVGNAQNEPQIYEVDVPTLGGEFTPKFGDNGFQSGIIESYEAYIGIPKRYKPSIIDNDIFGVSELGNNVTKSPAGGQGLNHFTTLGISSIVNPVLENCKWRS